MQWVNWVEERWWYKLVKVCQRWRHLILGSASHLGLCLVCSRGTPVAAMLAHFPPLPLVIIYNDSSHDFTPEDEGGIMFALEHRDRVQRIYLEVPVPGLQKVIKALDNQFPMLEYLHIAPLRMHNAHLVLPATFRAPQLNHLWLDHLGSSIGIPLLTNAVSLVTLWLRWIHPSTNFSPNHLLQALSLLPQLQDLTISSSSPVPNREIQNYMLHTPSITHTTLPNLRFFDIEGVSAYLEAFFPHINTPLLKTLRVTFFNQLSFSVPHLCKFVTTAENLRSSSVRFLFYHDGVAVFMYPSVSSLSPTLRIRVGCHHLDWQVASMAQIFKFLVPLLSAVVDLTLDYRGHTLSSVWHDRASRIQWRELLGSFRNVEVLRIHDGLVGEVTRCLALNGEPTSEIPPDLKTLVCPIGIRDDKTFARFVHDREVAGLPIDFIEDPFPAGQFAYKFETPAGVHYVDFDPAPLT